MATVKFARKAAGVHTAKINADRELALTSASGGFGWSLVVREPATRKIIKRLTCNIRTLDEGKQAANTLVNSPRFGALLLSIA